MQRRWSILFLLTVLSLSASAQTASVTGRVIDRQEKEPIERSTIQLLKTDTTFVGGTFSDERGAFVLNNITAGKYIVKVTNLGYKTLFRDITVERGKPYALGDLPMEVNTVELDEAQVTANLPPMVIKDDTIVYNADAFRVPEGSVIEALVEMLPGAKIDDNGGVTINGKEVKKVKLDGRDYDRTTTMKNLPSYLIDKVKAYDEKSDLSRMTGVDDGNDDFVLEFSVRPSMRKGLQANVDLGYGTHNRYGTRLTALKPFGDMRYTFMGNANNTNNRGFSGRGGRGRGNGSGQQTTKTSSLNVSYEKKNKIKADGRVTWSHENTDNWSRTGSESFVITRGGAFSNSVSQSYGRRNSWSGNLNLQWQIDSMTTLSFRPNASLNGNDSRSGTRSASFSANPFDYISDPVDAQEQQQMNELGLIVNNRKNKSLSNTDSKSLSSQLQLFRRFGPNGRNVALSTNINYGRNTNANANLSAVHLYQVQDRYGNDSTYQTNRYTHSPNNNFGYSLGITYTEPLIKPAANQPISGNEGPRGDSPGGGFRGRGVTANELPGLDVHPALYLQLSYRYNYSHQKNDPSTYDFPEYDDDAFDEVLEQYRDWARLFGYLDNPYESYLSTRLSRYSERTENGHQADVQLRLTHQRYNINVGLSAQPQHSHYIQQYLGRPVDTVRTVTNVSPTLNLRYRFNRQTNLQMNFRGSTSQPSITDLLDIYDDTNPLNIRMGNPGLKPSFSQNYSMNFQTSRRPATREGEYGMQIPVAQRNRAFSMNYSFQRTSNSIASVTTYNEQTGGRITRPENINGNWNTRGGFTLNLGLDTLNAWNLSLAAEGSYNHHITYVSRSMTASSERNVTHQSSIRPSSSINYRNKWLRVELDGNATYARTKNQLQASANLDTWNFSYGTNLQIDIPNGPSLSTNIHMHSRRGYADKTLNTNELLWNAQLSQSFLRRKALTVMLQFYDILKQQSNFSRTVNANGWTDRETNVITSYAMLHVSYRLNMFRGGSSRGRGEGRPDFEGGPRGERPEGFGGGRGGGRPGGFGGRGGGGFGGGGPM